MWQKSLAAFVSVCAMVSATHAAVTIDPIALSPPVVQSTPGIDKFNVKGADMVGMKVTAYFSDGSSCSGSWSATGGDSGGPGVTAPAGFGYWALDESGDTFIIGHWSVINLNFAGLWMTRLTVDAGPGKVVFDLNVDAAGNMKSGYGDLEASPPTGDSEGTFMSATGHTFEPYNAPTSYQGADTSQTLHVHTTYSNEVQLGAAPPVGDLWTTLDLTFIHPNVGDAPGLPDGDMFLFQADTDTALNLQQGPPPVPEPSSLVLLGGLLTAGAGYLRARKRRRAV
jgi:hypothetical protein